MPHVPHVQVLNPVMNVPGTDFSSWKLCLKDIYILREYYLANIIQIIQIYIMDKLIIK
jgi:hypothetical protein